MVFAIDFDGTLAVTKFPTIVAPREKVVRYVKSLKSQGHQIILWTCRVGEDLESAVKWCYEQGIVFDAINESLPEQIEYWGNDTRKVCADVYIDDKAVNTKEIESPIRRIIHCVRKIIGVAYLRGGKVL